MTTTGNNGDQATPQGGRGGEDGVGVPADAATGRAAHRERLVEAHAGGAEHVLKAMLNDAVIPRLVRSARASAPVPGDAERDLLLRLVLRGERDGAIALMRQCVVAGMRAERLADDMITTVARALGEEWESDTCDFVRVTYGSGLLAELLRELRELDPPRLSVGEETMPRCSALLAVVPGEQHTLGVSVLADAFERAGWSVARAERCDAASLVAEVARNRHDVVGLSIGSDRNVEGVTKLIALLRRMSRNAELAVIVGGTVLLRRPELARELGADGIGIDGAGAVELANVLCADRSRAAPA